MDQDRLQEIVNKYKPAILGGDHEFAERNLIFMARDIELSTKDDCLSRFKEILDGKVSEFKEILEGKVNESHDNK